MSNHIDFYFDIISPYAYIAHKKILKHKIFPNNENPTKKPGMFDFRKLKLRKNQN